MPLDYTALTAVRNKFLRYVSPEPNSGCWLWSGPVDGRGYGKFIYKKHAYTASRAAVIFDGRSVNNRVVCHKCDTPCCVNPEHLFVGTQADNIRDMHAKNRAAVGDKSPTAKLSSASVRGIRFLASLGRKQNVLAVQYRVSPMTISRAIRRQAWRTA